MTYEHAVTTRSGMTDYCAIYLSTKTITKRIGPTRTQVEAASTIKLPILIMVCEYNQKHRHTLNYKLVRSAEHTSNGSGILEWALRDGDSSTIRELIYYMMAYSDCLATNMLIQYVGGRDVINSWLMNQGFQTRLIMPYINFVSSDKFESVGITTAEEMGRLFEMLVSLKIDKAYTRLITAATTSLHLSWVGEKLPEKFPGIRGKTGSMIDCLPDHKSYVNIAGQVPIRGQAIYFSVFASGVTINDASVERLKAKVLSKLTEALERCSS